TKTSPPGVSGPRMDPLLPPVDGAGVGLGFAWGAGAAPAFVPVLSPVAFSCGLANANVVSDDRRTSIAIERALDCIWPPQSGVNETLLSVSFRHSAGLSYLSHGQLAISKRFTKAKCFFIFTRPLPIFEHRLNTHCHLLNE